MKLQIPVAVLQYCLPKNYCKIIVCDSFILDKESATEFVLSGDVQFRGLKQRAAVRLKNTHKPVIHTNIAFKVLTISYLHIYLAEYCFSETIYWDQCRD